jgi:hypothetical protein
MIVERFFPVAKRSKVKRETNGPADLLHFGGRENGYQRAQFPFRNGLDVIAIDGAFASHDDDYSATGQTVPSSPVGEDTSSLNSPCATGYMGLARFPLMLKKDLSCRRCPFHA